MNIIYKEIDSAVEDAIAVQYGNWVHDCGCFIKGEGCCLIAAIDTENGAVAGFSALHPARWIAPLEQYCDGFIEVIEVAKPYRRQGIGKSLVRMLEKYAAEYGYYQIRAWSSCEQTEALHMWRRLNYCMCPAAMLGQSIHDNYAYQQIVGYYNAKLLNPDK